MVRDEEGGQSAHDGRDDGSHGGDVNGRAAASPDDGGDGGMTSQAPAPTASSASPAAATFAASAPAHRLAQARSVIEHLQQNLSTQLKTSTVEALRSSYANTPRPSLDAKQADATDLGAASAEPPRNGDAVQPREEPPTGSRRASGEKDRSEKGREDGKYVGNGIVRDGLAVDVPDGDVTLRKKTEGPGDDSEIDARSIKSIDSSEKSPADDKADGRDKETKTRVSWTTRLLERLSQEEKTKKESVVVKRVVQPNRRLVRYPGQKDFVPTHVPAIAKRVSSPPQPSRDERKLSEDKGRGSRSRSEERNEERSKRTSSTVSSASTSSADAKDGYAELINELTAEKDRQPECARRPESVPVDLYSSLSVFEGHSPRSPPSAPAAATPAHTSLPTAPQAAGIPSRKTLQGDYFLYGKDFVEANTNPIYIHPRAITTKPREHSPKFSPDVEYRAMNVQDASRSERYSKSSDAVPRSSVSPRPMDLSRKPLSLVNNSSFDEDSDYVRSSPRQPYHRPASVDIPGYTSDSGRLRMHSPLLSPGSDRGSSASPKRSPLSLSGRSGAKGGQRSPGSDAGSVGRPRSASPRTVRKSPGTPSGLRRLLSPGSLFSSSRQQQRPSSGVAEDTPERRPLLGTAKVSPVQSPPLVETAFLSNASPTKQNQANLSRRSKSVSPSRERALHHAHHQHQPRQHHLQQPQPAAARQLQMEPHAPPPSPSSPATPPQQQQQQHQLLLLQRAPLRQGPSPQTSPRQLQQLPPQRASPRSASAAAAESPGAGSGDSPRALEERFQQLRRELSPRAGGADALVPLPLQLPSPPRAACDSPDSAAAVFVRSRRDVRYASLPARYARPASAPLHLQQPIYENLQARYVAPVALDLERHAISGSPEIRQLQQQKRQLLLHQRQQQQQLYLLQQQGYLSGRDSPLMMAEPTYGRAGAVSAAVTAAAPTPPPHQPQPRRAHQPQALPARAASAEPVQLRHKPIFKRGSLVATDGTTAAAPASPDGSGGAPKRVSFTGGEPRGGPGAGWPTRNGPAPQPPTRQHLEAALAPAAPTRPLPPVPLQHLPHLYYHSESESGSEAGEVQRILMRHHSEEEWGAEGKGRGPPGSDHAAPSGGRDDDLRRSGGGGARSGRRDEPRRHTLSGDHHHQHQAGSLARSMDLEMSSKSQRRKSPLPRGYPPPSTAMLFDDDPGIMSEVETSSTGFRRGGKQRSSLPVVRTPSKTLERPLGLVFLQYRSETKRALLPNEITSIDTVKALFVRSFPKQLTMEYLDSPHVKIYIHDSSKDMFYELEDVRSHLRDIRDRSVLRLFESADMNGGVLPGAGVGVMAPSMWDQDQSYFSEPEFDSEYQHQHIHKTKTSSKGGSGSMGQQPYYMTHSYPPGGGTPGSAPATLPRGGPLLRAYSPAVVTPVPADRIKTIPQSGVQPPPKPVRMYQQVKGPINVGPRVPERTYASFSSPSRGRAANVYSSPDRLHSESGYMSSPERGGPRAYPAPYASGAPGYEDPYYSQYASRSGSITPVIDEEASDTELMDEQYSLYGVKLRPVAPQPPRGQFPAPQTVGPYDTTRLRVENMERQLANLTGLVQKALTQTPTPREYLQVPAATRDANYRNAVDEYDKHSSSSSASLPDDTYLRTDTKPPKLGKDKSVSFEKSVSFSDEPPDMNSPKQHSPQHTADSKPTKPAIKSSTLPRMSSQERTERDRHKPAPPPKPVSLSPGQYEGRHVYRDLHLTPEMYNQLRGLQKKAKDLRQEVRNLRRMSQAQAHTVRETIRDTFIKIRTMLLLGGEEAWAAGGDAEKLRLNREEDAYKQEMLRLEKDLTELESTVEELRGNVINRKTRVNMSDVENMALILSKSSKTVADLKVRFPSLQEGMKSLLSSEMEKVVREEKFLKEEPERLESALRRCKKLTGTLVTLKRLASVQEQRLPVSTPEARLSPTLGTDSDPPITPPAHGKTGTIPTRGVLASTVSSGSDISLSRQRPENALDALLDELQTFAKPPSNTSHNPSMSEIGRKGSIDSAHPSSSSPSIITGASSSLRRLHSYPSSSDGGGSSPPTVPLSRLQVSGPADPPKSPATSPKPPVPERNSELLSQLVGRRVPPPPPPRTSSRSPLASPTSPLLPPKGQHPPNQPQMGVGGGTLLRRGSSGRSSLREPLRGSHGISLPTESKAPAEDILSTPGTFNPLSASNSSSCESVNSQEGLQNKSGNKARQEILEQRHQELLRKQRALQEQYARLQQLQRGGGGSLTVVPPPDLLLKKTGSESNLLAKMGLGHGLTAAAPISGSLRNLAAVAVSNPPIMSVSGPSGGFLQKIEANNPANISTVSSATEATVTTTNASSTTTTTTNKIYETDIL